MYVLPHTLCKFLSRLAYSSSAAWSIFQLTTSACDLVPQRRTKVQLFLKQSTHPAEASEEDSGDEAVSRDTMKKQAASLVEARTAKPKKKKGRGDDDD